MLGSKSWLSVRHVVVDVLLLTCKKKTDKEMRGKDDVMKRSVKG